MENQLIFPFLITLFLYIFKPVLNIFAGFANVVVFFLGGLQMSSAEANRSHWDLFDVCLMYLNRIGPCQLTFHQAEKKKKKRSAHCDQLVRNGQMK